jgi:hypothetical protein
VETDSVARVFNLYLAWLEANRARPIFEKALRHLRSFGQKTGPDLKVTKLRPFHVQRRVDEKLVAASDSLRRSGTGRQMQATGTTGCGFSFLAGCGSGRFASTAGGICP